MTVIKLSARGLAALRLLPRDGEGPDATAQRGLDAALAIYDAVQAGTCPTPKYLLRFMPFASTCLLELKALGQCAARLAPLAAPLLQGAGHPTFGIGLHNRRTEHNNGKGSDIDRMEMIKAAAAGFTQALKEQFGVDACVDLKAPAVVLCIEVVSVMGQLYACMGALPQRVCMLKPKLAMQHLAAHAGKASAGKGDRQTGSKAGPAAQESEPTPAA